jgi:outer membrane protein OmpA-like peptidoglycan-associated protein
MPHLGQLPGKISEWLEGSATKPDVDDPNGVSLEDAIAHPELLDDCRKKVRFPNGLLFERDKADIQPELTTQLARLAELRQRYPNRYLVVTGHSDATGEIGPDGQPSETGHQHNLELSRQRAEAISQWLAANQVWPENALRSEGYGSTQPLLGADLPISVISQVGIDRNRRVEIGFDCRKD